jgi:hypothetical protein
VKINKEIKNACCGMILFLMQKDRGKNV